MAKEVRDRGRGRLGHGYVTSGLRDEVWIEQTSYVLDGERLYEVHDVSRALKHFTYLGLMASRVDHGWGCR